MSEMEKYLDALEAAVAAKDKTAMTLLEPFATHLYKEIYARAEAASGEGRAAQDVMLQRVKGIISGIAKASPDLW